MAQIQHPASIKIERHIETVLQALFANFDRVTIQHEFDSGLSGSKVYQIKPAQNSRGYLPAVIKVDRFKKIEREWEAFQNTIDRRLPQAAVIWQEPVYPKGSEWAGLGYKLAGEGIFAVESLGHFIANNEFAAISALFQEQIFRSLGQLWSQGSVQHEMPIRAVYDSFLPPNLEIDLSQVPPGNVQQYVSPMNTAEAAQLQSGNFVQTYGFEVIKIGHDQQATSGRLVLEVPQGDGRFPNRFRIQLTNVPDIENHQIGIILHQPLQGKVVRTRAEMMAAQVKTAVSSALPTNNPTLTLFDQTELPNPLHELPNLLNRFITTRIAPIHGDLHLENILVEQGNRVAFIDFAKSGDNHLLRDLMHLELAIVTKMLPPLMAADFIAHDYIVPFYTALHNGLSQNQEATTIRPAVEKPFQLLRLLRQEAVRYFHNQSSWQEYYLGMILYLLGALKFADLDRLPTAPRPKQVAFWGAAALLKLLQRDDRPQFQVGQPQPTAQKPQKGSVQPGTTASATAEPSYQKLQGFSWEFHVTDKKDQPVTFQADIRTLTGLITGSFRESELRLAVQPLNAINGFVYSDLPGDTYSGRVNELILWFDRRTDLHHLIQTLYQERPTANWQSN